MSGVADPDIVDKHPLGKPLLDSFRDDLNARCKQAGIPENATSNEKVARLADTSAMKELALKLIASIATTPLAAALPSSWGNISLQIDLFQLGGFVGSDQFKGKSFTNVFEEIERHATDQAICNALLSLLRVRAVTPPSLSKPSKADTPCKSKSASLTASELKHAELDARIKQEINGCVYKNTGGFYEKYFEKKSWSGTAEQIIEQVYPQMSNGRSIGYPLKPSQDDFLGWLSKFEKKLPKNRRGTYYSAANNILSGASGAKRKPDVFLGLNDTTLQTTNQYDWKDVRVIGEPKQSRRKSGASEEILQLCGYAREVFISQPTRLFLHGFIIRGSHVELWIFDRSGLYSSEQFDIHKDPRRFITIMFGYTLMSDTELGFNPHIKTDGIGRYVEYKTDKGAEIQKLYLQQTTLASPRAIICRATTCYRARTGQTEPWDYVVKLAWRSSGRMAEGEMLQLAKDRNVWGIVNLINHRDNLESIASLREGLKFGNRQKFKCAKRDSIDQTQSRLKYRNTMSEALVSVGAAVEQKRKRVIQTSPHPVKRPRRSSRLSNSKSAASGTNDPSSNSVNTQQSSNSISTHPSSIGVPPKYPSPLSASMSAQDPSSSSASMSAYDPSSSSANIPARDAPPHTQHPTSFEDRILSCLVMSPPGRSINTFESVHELLSVFRDVLRAHQSLYTSGRILHRDISANNIIIVDTPQNELPRGLLIDLDLGIELDSNPSGARFRTGTIEFMAIEVLEGKTPHTYRHDLESLFYALIWTIIRNKRDHIPDDSCLRNWYRSGYELTAVIKLGYMVKEKFADKVLEEFPEPLHRLTGFVEGLRDILFSSSNGGPFLGTPEDPEKLYGPMQKAFEEEIPKWKA